MKMRTMIAGLAAMTAMFVVALVAEAADVSHAKCPVSGKPVKEASSVDFDGGKVFFCCNNCPKAFAAHPDKYAAKAHEQLVVTGQAKQVKCPISGKPIKADQSTEVDGVKVSFCCPNCKAKVENADAAEQVELCFGAKAFKKAYKVSK